jgi:hypothetical protein
MWKMLARRVEGVQKFSLRKVRCFLSLTLTMNGLVRSTVGNHRRFTEINLRVTSQKEKRFPRVFRYWSTRCANWKNFVLFVLSFLPQNDSLFDHCGGKGILSFF